MFSFDASHERANSSLSGSQSSPRFAVERSHHGPVESGTQPSLPRQYSVSANLPSLQRSSLLKSSLHAPFARSLLVESILQVSPTFANGSLQCAAPLSSTEQPSLLQRET